MLGELGSGDLVEDLRERGVVVYLISTTHEYNHGLVQIVGNKHWIRLDMPLGVVGVDPARLFSG